MEVSFMKATVSAKYLTENLYSYQVRALATFSEMKLKLFNRRPEYASPVEDVAETSFMQES